MTSPAARLDGDCAPATTSALAADTEISFSLQRLVNSARPPSLAAARLDAPPSPSRSCYTDSGDTAWGLVTRDGGAAAAAAAALQREARGDSARGGGPYGGALERLCSPAASTGPPLCHSESRGELTSTGSPHALTSEGSAPRPRWFATGSAPAAECADAAPRQRPYLSIDTASLSSATRFGGLEALDRAKDRRSLQEQGVRRAASWLQQDFTSETVIRRASKWAEESLTTFPVPPHLGAALGPTDDAAEPPPPLQPPPPPRSDTQDPAVAAHGTGPLVSVAASVAPVLLACACMWAFATPSFVPAPVRRLLSLHVTGERLLARCPAHVALNHVAWPQLVWALLLAFSVTQMLTQIALSRVFRTTRARASAPPLSLLCALQALLGATWGVRQLLPAAAAALPATVVEGALTHALVSAVSAQALKLAPPLPAGSRAELRAGALRAAALAAIAGTAAAALPAPWSLAVWALAAALEVLADCALLRERRRACAMGPQRAVWQAYCSAVAAICGAMRVAALLPLLPGGASAEFEVAVLAARVVAVLLLPSHLARMAVSMEAAHIACVAAVAVQGRQALFGRKAEELDYMKRQVLLMATHELNTPLHEVLGCLDALTSSKGTASLPSETRIFAETAKSSAAHVSRLVRSMLDAVQLRKGPMRLSFERVSLSHLLHPLATLPWRSLAPKPGSQPRLDDGRGSSDGGAAAPQLRVAIEADVPCVRANADCLLQALFELVSNAFKYSRDDVWVRVTRTAGGGGVRVSVEDAGVGIPADQQAHIWGPFHQVMDRGALGAARPQEGLGLGLYLVSGILQAHGCAIECESTLGVGTRIAFTLPAFRDSQPAAAPPPPPLPPPSDAAADSSLVGTAGAATASLPTSTFGGTDSSVKAPGDSAGSSGRSALQQPGDASPRTLRQSCFWAAAAPAAAASQLDRAAEHRGAAPPWQQLSCTSSQSPADAQSGAPPSSSLLSKASVARQGPWESHPPSSTMSHTLSHLRSLFNSSSRTSTSSRLTCSRSSSNLQVPNDVGGKSSSAENGARLNGARQAPFASALYHSQPHPSRAASTVPSRSDSALFDTPSDAPPAPQRRRTPQRRRSDLMPVSVQRTSASGALASTWAAGAGAANGGDARRPPATVVGRSQSASGCEERAAAPRSARCREGMLSDAWLDGFGAAWDDASEGSLLCDPHSSDASLYPRLGSVSFSPLCDPAQRATFDRSIRDAFQAADGDDAAAEAPLQRLDAALSDPLVLPVARLSREGTSSSDTPTFCPSPPVPLSSRPRLLPRFSLDGPRPPALRQRLGHPPPRASADGPHPFRGTLSPPLDGAAAEGESPFSSSPGPGASPLGGGPPPRVAMAAPDKAASTYDRMLSAPHTDASSSSNRSAGARSQPYVRGLSESSFVGSVSQQSALGSFILPRQASKPVIMSIDDNAINQMILQRMLTSSGFEFVKAMGAEEALSMLQRADPMPDLLLMDIMMPGINGYDLCREVRRQYPGRFLPTIFVSSNSKPEHIVDGLAAGAQDYMTKPVNKQELIARIHAQLDQRAKMEQVATELAHQLLYEKLGGRYEPRLSLDTARGSIAATATSTVANNPAP